MYKIPKCNCGTKLIISEYGITYREKKIRKDGKPYKKPQNKIIDYCAGVENKLYCKSCGNEYMFDYDDKGRVIRGEKWDKFWDG